MGLTVSSGGGMVPLPVRDGLRLLGEEADGLAGVRRRSGLARLPRRKTALVPSEWGARCSLKFELCDKLEPLSGRPGLAWGVMEVLIKRPDLRIRTEVKLT